MGDSSSILLNVSLLALACAAIVLFVALIMYADVCRHRATSSTNTTNANATNMQSDFWFPDALTRENIEDTVLEDGQHEWQCIVCLHINSPMTLTCPLCGTSQDASTLAPRSSSTLLASESMQVPPMSNNSTTAVLAAEPMPLMGAPLSNGSTAMLENTVLGATFLSNGAGPSSMGSILGDARQLSERISLQRRQRALRYRRLNRMQLTQRQKSALRRRLWQRVPLPTGQFVWVRSLVPLVNKRSKWLDRIRGVGMGSQVLTEEGGNFGLSGTVVEQLHRKNAATLGFYSAMDEDGVLEYKKTTDAVAIPIDDVHPWVLSEMDLDLEGLMSLPFKEKKRWFLHKMNALAVPFMDGMLRLSVRRDFILEDSVLALGGDMSDVEARQHLNITFLGEPALDAGGVLREWFGLVTHSLFSAELGLFYTTQGQNASYWINPDSVHSPVGPFHLEYYRFAGRLLGKAILDNLVLDFGLALPLLKHLLGVPITFSDLEFLDEELYKSCQWVRTNANVDTLCLTFSVQMPHGEEIELKPGGRDIEVTDENKEEYLALVLRYRMFDSVAPQLSELLGGLYEIIPKGVLAVFDYQELDFFLGGVPTINVQDWKRTTRVRHCAPERNPQGRAEELQVISWFWHVVERFTDEERARLLQFSTGSSRVPVEGFKALTSASGYIHPFTIQLVPRGEPPLGLCPRAHTCFNRIDLPHYRDRQELETYLTLVIQMEITGFGFE